MIVNYTVNYANYANHSIFVNYASSSVRPSGKICTVMHREQMAGPRSANFCTHLQVVKVHSYHRRQLRKRQHGTVPTDIYIARDIVSSIPTNIYVIVMLYFITMISISIILVNSSANNVTRLYNFLQLEMPSGA